MTCLTKFVLRPRKERSGASQSCDVKIRTEKKIEKNRLTPPTNTDILQILAKEFPVK